MPPPNLPRDDTPNVFEYNKPLPSTDPTCVSTFSRAFAHQDWVDGESVVQAEQTTGEDGFNLRFHRIEQDLDNLAKDLRTAFTCIATLRASLVPLLTEISVELNRINAEVFDIKLPPIDLDLPDPRDETPGRQPPRGTGTTPAPPKA